MNTLIAWAKDGDLDPTPLSQHGFSWQVRAILPARIEKASLQPTKTTDSLQMPGSQCVEELASRRPARRRTD